MASEGNITNTVRAGEKESSKDEQIQILKEINAKFLTLLEAQEASKGDEEEKFYKRLASHKPRSYDGEADLGKFEDWVNHMTKVLEVVSCLEHLKVKMASFYWEGPDIWWNTTKEISKQPDFSWAKFTEKLKDKFFPPALRRMKENEYLFLRQAKMFVLEYAAKFLELSRFAPDFVANERIKSMRFFEGLNLKYQKRVAPYSTFEELYDRPWNKLRWKMKSFVRGKMGGKARQRAQKELKKKERVGPLLSLKGEVRRLISHCRLCGMNHYGRNCSINMSITNLAQPEKSMT